MSSFELTTPYPVALYTCCVAHPTLFIVVGGSVTSCGAELARVVCPVIISVQPLHPEASLQNSPLERCWRVPVGTRGPFMAPRDRTVDYSDNIPLLFLDSSGKFQRLCDD